MSFGQAAVDFERRINFDRMRKERLERARKIAQQKGVGALIALHGDNARYLGHNVPKGTTQGANGFRFMFFPINAQPILYEYGMYQPYAKAGVDWMEVRYAPSFVPQGPPEARLRQYQKAAATIKKDLTDANLLDEKIAIDVYNYGLISALEKEGVKVSLEGDAVMREARMIKTEDELECLKSVSAIVEGGYEELRRNLSPGTVERDAKAKFVSRMFQLGADAVATGEVTSGPRTFSNINITTDRIMRHGDLVIGQGCNTAYLGYKACLYRTFAVSTPSETQNDCFAQTRDILLESMKAVKPGATTKDIAEKWPKASEFGYKDEDQALWLQWSHGVGLAIPEEPTSSRLWSFDHPQRIEEGMVLAVEDWLPTRENNETYPRGQSVRIEEMIHVTSSGAELISKYPLDELIRPL